MFTAAIKNSAVYNANLERARTAAHSLEASAKRAETFTKIAHQQGEHNSNYRSRWITNEATNKKLAAGEPVPEGWRSERCMLDPKERAERQSLASSRSEARAVQLAQKTKWHKAYCSGGFAAVQALGYDKSQQNLVQVFKALLPEFVPQAGMSRAKKVQLTE